MPPPAIPVITALAVVPHSPSVSSNSSKKRTISPSPPFQPSPKRSLLLFSPGQVPSQVSVGNEVSVGGHHGPIHDFRDQRARVADHYSNTTSSHSYEKQTWNSNHILLPFDLRDPRLSIVKGEPKAMLWSIFPNTIAVGESVPRRFLNFQVQQFPSRPWPLTIGGLPFTICTEGQGRGPMFPALKCGDLRISICQNFDVRTSDRYLCDGDFRQLTATVADYFHDNHPNVMFREVIITMTAMLYVVLDGVEIRTVQHKLPGRIAGCMAGYLHEKELHRPQISFDLKAKRAIQPKPFSGIADTTAYDVLRPGVMIWSEEPAAAHAHPATCSTTSGVLVRNGFNDHFMTGASHGIGVNGIVYQPQPDGHKRQLGTAVQEITHTDIALVKLQDDVEFVNETFEDDAGNITAFTRICGEHPDDHLGMTMWPNRFYLNSPVAGNIEGALTMRSCKVESDTPYPAADEVQFVTYIWTYTGQVDEVNKNEPPEGVCGSAIWDDDGVIRGFFRYYITEGWLAGHSVSVNAIELFNAGYKLGGAGSQA